MDHKKVAEFVDYQYNEHKEMLLEVEDELKKLEKLKKYRFLIKDKKEIRIKLLIITKALWNDRRERQK